VFLDIYRDKKVFGVFVVFVLHRNRPKWLGKFGAFFVWFNCLQRFWTCFFPVCSIIFLTGIFLILAFLQIDWKESGSGIYLLLLFSVLFFFATSVPELGGTVGYELNLFLQDYIGKTGTLWFWFWSDHLRYFLNLNSQKESNPSSKIQKKLKQI
jgi:hypothetical protein